MQAYLGKADALYNLAEYKEATGVYKEALDKLIKDIAPRFEKRQGGYTRIIRLGERFSDRAKVVLIEWTESAKNVILSENRTTAEAIRNDGKTQDGKNKEDNKIKSKPRKMLKDKK